MKDDKYDWYKAGGFPQGDVLIEIVDNIDDKSTVIEPENGNNVIAHSETGHHHVIPAQDSVLYAANEEAFTTYVEVKNDTSIVHLRSYDTHKTRHVKAGTMLRISRQTQESAEGTIIVQD